jgi:hypothetical protein
MSLLRNCCLVRFKNMLDLDYTASEACFQSDCYRLLHGAHVFVTTFQQELERERAFSVQSLRSWESTFELLLTLYDWVESFIKRNLRGIMPSALPAFASTLAFMRSHVMAAVGHVAAAGGFQKDATGDGGRDPRGCPSPS